jgi:hypothetical protein
MVRIRGRSSSHESATTLNGANSDAKLSRRSSTLWRNCSICVLTLHTFA